ncbi:MAG: RnfABCDGE type electron transport complex subunit G [Lentisphaerae bacterium]|jgi:electron transport complex protein RnfG|nr:RnfABCDGE type electron transport complex subunit G [Lentisphaerota bacterium]
MSEQKINIPKLGIFLGVVAAVASGLLAAVNVQTKPQIEKNAALKKEEAMNQVLPPFKKLVSLEKAIDGATFSVALDENNVPVGIAGVAEQEGFSGPVEVMVGLNPDGTIRKVLVTKQTETPGLGTVITDRKIQKTINDLFHPTELVGLPPNQYLDQYETATSETTWTVTKDGGDIDAKTGATITSRAVCAAVSKVYKAYNGHSDEILKGAE